MKNKIAILVVISICFSLFVNLIPIYACSPAPWKFEEAYNSKAMIYGKVIKTNNDNREATVEVISYIGPDKPPHIVYLPSTKDSRKVKQGYQCPDFQ